MYLLIPVFFALGLAIGSFLNVCIDRLPRGQSIIRPPSYCAACYHKLGALDLIPVFSYLWLRGRCRYCRAPIPPKLPIMEGVTGLLFAFLYWKYGLALELGILLVYASILIVIFVIDLENQLILDKVTYPAMALALVLASLWPGFSVISLLPQGLPGRALSALAGGALGLIAMALPFIIYRRGMGMGDVKMGALVGLMTGYPLVFVAILISWISGGLVAAMLLAFRIKGLKDPIPSGTFLAVAAMVTLLWGREIWQWYLP
ncbi:MAG: prepilin peptidase [Dehalococcoidales bacterium]|nr:prepilin peptidase [Dehalococcoidales bacterium]MDZ4230696.1 prepilin peptidase [Dehalococcoidales bacterium]